MQIATGEFFGAERMVRVTSAHLTGDPESMGDAGLAFATHVIIFVRLMASRREGYRTF